MLIILVSVVLEVGLFSFREAFVHVLMEYMNVGFVGAHTVFATACLFVAAPALYRYRSEFLGWFNRTSSVPSIPEINRVQTQPRITQSPTDRVYTNRTLGEIFNSIQDCTSMQINSIVRPHIGKWLKVNYIVKDVQEYSDEISISVEGSIDKGIFLRFQKKLWKATLETVKEGDRLIAEGTIGKIDKHSIRVTTVRLIME